MTLIASALLLGAAVARLARLGADGLWVDEAWTALLVRESPGRLLDLLRTDDAPPLFYLLQRLAATLTSGSEWGLRVLPALAGTGAVAAAWRLCRRHAPRAAIPAAAALGFSTVAVHYARQARSYAVLHLLAVLALGAALSLRERPGMRTGAWFVLACLGLAYSHNIGVLLVGAAILTGVIPLLAERLHRRTGLTVLGILALGMIPWMAALLPQLGVHNMGNAWMGEWWKGRGGVFLGPIWTLPAMANGAAAALHLTVPLPAFPPSLESLCWVSWGLVAAGLTGALVAARKPRTAERRPSRPASAQEGLPAVTAGVPADRSLLGGAAIFTLVPLFGLVAISLLAGPAYVVGRTDTLALPGLAILLGIGWTRGPRLLAPIAMSAWIVLGVAALAPTWSGNGRTAKSSDRALASLLRAEIKPGDVVVFSALSRPTLEYYGRRLGWWDRAGWKGSFPNSFDRNAAAPWPAPLDSAITWQREAIALRKTWEQQETGAAWILALRDPVTGGGAISADGPTAWPSRPTPPPSARARRGAQSLAYPGNVLVSALVGLKPAEVGWEYRQDWVSGDRLLLRLPRASWVPVDSIPRLEAEP